MGYSVVSIDDLNNILNEFKSLNEFYGIKIMIS